MDFVVFAKVSRVVKWGVRKDLPNPSTSSNDAKYASGPFVEQEKSVSATNGKACCARALTHVPSKNVRNAKHFVKLFLILDFLI